MNAHNSRSTTAPRTVFFVNGPWNGQDRPLPWPELRQEIPGRGAYVLAWHETFGYYARWEKETSR